MQCQVWFPTFVASVLFKYCNKLKIVSNFLSIAIYVRILYTVQ